MSPNNRFLLAITTLAAVASLVNAQDGSKPKPSADAKVPASTNTVAKAVKQADIASKSANFDTVFKTNDLYKTAIDAHALEKAAKQVGKDGAFKGTVAKIFEPRGGVMAIMNFDANYQSALTALLRKDDFDKFPALTNLVNKEVVVTGKFIDYQGHAEIVLTNTSQIKLVQ